jgi:hypothetical protein
MSFLDNIIGTLFPTWQLRRVEAREAARRYEAAGTGKRTRHRRGPSTSARAEVSMAGPYPAEQSSAASSQQPVGQEGHRQLRQLCSWSRH